MSPRWYTTLMFLNSTIALSTNSLPGAVGRVVRDARAAIGWSQDELAERSLTSQTRIWRIERGDPRAFDLATTERVLGALGLSCDLLVQGRQAAERAAQRDIVHAALVDAVARRLRRAGWKVEVEVATGPGTPTGWIDILAFRESDGALLVVEAKTRLDDIGGALRQVTFYEREAVWAARRLGWQPAFTRSLLLGIDSVEVADAVRANRGLLAPALTGVPDRMEAWILRASAASPADRTLAFTDLARRRNPTLKRTPLSGRRSAPTYTGYAEIATMIRAREPDRRTAGPEPARRTAA